MRNLIFLLTFLFSFSSFAQGPMGFCSDDLETFPVLAQGREKPLYVLANDSIRFITGEKKVGDLSAVEAFCKLSLKVFGMPLELPVNVKVDHVDVRKFLGMDENAHSIPVNELMKKSDLIEGELRTRKENNAFRKELTKVMGRLRTYEAVTGGQAWTVPVVQGDKLEFVPLADFLSEDRVMSAQGSGNPVATLMEKAKNDYIKMKGDHYLLELKYFKLNLFLWAMILSLLAIFAFVLTKNRTFGTVLTVSTILIQISAMTMRILISGRAPVTNMYETVMFSGFGALVIASIITLYRKEIAFVIAGLAYNVLCLMMMKFANSMLDPGISPLVPVLRDNFWLSTHVTTVILSYAALALSWLLANSILIRSALGKLTPEEHRYQVDLTYTCIKFGVVLLSGGVILGGVWADYSWGRFWGWDPKETWSLIVLLVYMAILHGKYSSWIPPRRFIPLVAGAFMTVMMAWFGVNYILATGLHSYGFSEGGAIFLGSFFLLQIALLVVTQMRAKVAA
jgi:ABC-type transport system involved in cytochrome c biogenesis permease subunit